MDIAAHLKLPRLPSYLERVDQELRKAAAADSTYLQEPISRLLGARGKRLRPTLVIGVAASQNAKIDRTVINGCVAIELVHLASLVHDDIIDHADTRNGVSAVASKEGPDCALLVGDHLFARAGMAAAGVSAEAAQIIESVIVELCDGQARELADRFDLDRSEASLLKSIDGKTAALFSAACRMGAACTGMDRSRIEAFAGYGRKFGMAFQLVDDVLDFISTSALMGKPIGNDVRDGTYTLPVILALASPHGKRVEELLKKGNQQELVNLLVSEGFISAAIRRMQGYNRSVARELSGFAGTSGLAGLPEAYLRWALKRLVHESYQPAFLVETEEP